MVRDTSKKAFESKLVDYTYFYESFIPGVIRTLYQQVKIKLNDKKFEKLLLEIPILIG